MALLSEELSAQRTLAWSMSMTVHTPLEAAVSVHCENMHWG